MPFDVVVGPALRRGFDHHTGRYPMRRLAITLAGLALAAACQSPTAPTQPVPVRQLKPIPADIHAQPVTQPGLPG